MDGILQPHPHGLRSKKIILVFRVSRLHSRRLPTVFSAQPLPRSSQLPQRPSHSCSTQQLFYEVEIICFPLIFMTQQTVMMLVSLAGQIVYSTAVSDVNDKLMDFCCFLLFSAISMILLKKLCQFCATGVKSSAFCISIQHLQLIQL